MMKRLLIFTSILCFSLNVVGQNKKEWKLIDENGEVLFTSKAKYVSAFENGLAKVYMQEWDGKQWNQGYGFINKKGELVIPAIYKSCHDFDDSLVTWVQDNDKKWWLINREGKIIPTKNYSKVGSFFKINDGISAVYDGEKMGFIDRTGKEIIPCLYSGSSAFHENRTCVYRVSDPKALYGFIDRKGNVAIDFQFSQAGTSSFFKGTCRVQKKGTKTYLIDTMGNTVFTTKYGSMQNMNFGLAPVSLGTAFDKWCFINDKDEIVIKGPFDHTREFSESGLTDFEIKDKKGVIDTTGKIIMEAKYETVYYDLEEDGYYCGVYGDKDNPKSLYDSDKDYFLEGFKKLELPDVIYLGSAKFSDRILYTTKEKKSGYINRKGEVIIKAQYEKANYFSDGVAWVR